MPSFQVHRLREHERQRFRWAPHTSGVSTVKPKDYEKISELEAPTEYAAWLALRDAGAPLAVGDLLETETGGLRICKYIGFEEARWFVVEARAETPPAGEAGEQVNAVAQPLVV